MSRGVELPGRVARAASVVGREHQRLRRSGQDAVALTVSGDRLVAVVADGCGSEAASEVGAILGVRFLSTWLAAHGGAEPKAGVEELVEWLRTVLDSGGLTGSARDLVLFTLLAAVWTPEEVVVFGVGDGAVVVDGSIHRLDPGPFNAPPYCGLSLLLGTPLEVTVHHRGPARSVAVMTDGLDPYLRHDPGAVHALVASSLGQANPYTLQRELNLLADQGRMSDDATIAVLGVPAWS